QDHGRSIREAIEGAGADFDAAADAGPSRGSRTAGPADGLIVAEYCVGDGHGRVECDLDTTPQACASRSAAAAWTAQGQVMGERAVRYGDDRAGKGRNGAATADNALSTGTAAAADGLIPGQCTVGDRQGGEKGEDATTIDTRAYVGVLERDGAWGQDAADRLVAGEGRTKQGQGPIRKDVDGAAAGGSKSGNGVGAVGADSHIGG